MLGPCRLPYTLIENDMKKTDESYKNISKVSKYLLSTRDLCGLEFLPKLINAGVMCFKIEGRMKNAEYVATVTRIYRKYIDLALSNNPYKIDKKDIEDLSQVFNRGNFSCGHFDSKPNKNLVYDEKQNHMGIYIGNIASLKTNKNHVFVNLTEKLSLGDSVQFEKENTKYTVSELMVKGKNVCSAFNSQLVEIGRMKGNFHVGDKIYRIASKELSTFAKASYQDEHKKVLLNAQITLKKNEPISLKVSTYKSTNPLFEDINVSFTSTDVPTIAISKPIDKERILSQLNKTNNTIFTFNKIDVELDDNLFLPSIKILNELRRNALEEIFYTAQSRLLRNSPSLTNINLPDKTIINKKKKVISVLLNILDEDKDYTNLKNIDNIYIPLKYFSNKKYENIISSICNTFNTYIYLPTIIKGNYKNLLNNVIEKSIDNFSIKGFVIPNLGNCIFIEKMKEKYKDKFEFIGNYTLNVYNHQTEQELKNLGIHKLTISPELDEQTINSITKNKFLEQELIVYGRTPLMSMNYCLLGKTNKCYPTCGIHCKDNKEYYLKDRLNFNFRIIPDNTQTVTTIYNSKITSIIGSLFDVSSYRIDILDETIDNINSIISTVLAGKRLEGKDYTNGNLSREI